MSAPGGATVSSPSFAFPAIHDARLAAVGAQAERFFADEPNTRLLKLRQFEELLALTNLSALGLTQEPATHARPFRGESSDKTPTANRLMLPDNASSTPAPKRGNSGKALS